MSYKPIDKVLSFFPDAKPTGKGWMTRCPAHDDQNPSLWIHEDNDQNVHLKCFAGCASKAVRDAVGLHYYDTLAVRHDRVYHYTDAEGHPLFDVVLFHNLDFKSGKKVFGQGVPESIGWNWGIVGKGIKTVLYRLPEVVEAVRSGQTIFIAEGEKDVETLRRMDFVATTNPGGAGKWSKDYSKYLKGADVVLLFDNDEAGHKHRDLLLTSLQGVASRLRVLPPFPQKDVSDWIGDGGTPDAFRRMVEEAPVHQSNGHGAVILSEAPHNEESTIIHDESQKELVAPSSVSISRPINGHADASAMEDARIYESLSNEVKQVFLNANHTDIGYAECLVALYGNRIRFASSPGAQKGSWLVWNGSYWEENAIMVRKFATQVARLRVMAGTYGNKPELVKHKAIKFVIDTMRAAEQSCWIDRACLDQGNLLPLKNATINLDKLEVYEPRREDYQTYCLEYEYNHKADCPRVKKFLSEIIITEDGATDNDLLIEFQKWAGYALTTHVREEIFPLLWGTGANGKSKLLELLRLSMGRFATAVDSRAFEADFQDDKGRVVASFFKKRLIIANETEKHKRLKTSFVKRLTGGDTLTGSPMYQDRIEFEPTHKILFAFNHKPKVDGRDEAIWRRILLIPFRAKFEGERADKKILEKLSKELPGFLNWRLDGLRMYYRDGLQLHKIESVRHATKSYRIESDSIGRFLKECCMFRPDLNVVSSVLYANYKEWCEQTGDQPIRQNEFSQTIEGIDGVIKKTPKNKRVFQGIGLLEVERDEPEGSTGTSAGLLFTEPPI